MIPRIRSTVTPGTPVIVEIPYSDRPALRPLLGKLRTVELTADRRVLIYEEDGRRYQFAGRPLPAVAPGEASILTDRVTGRLYAWTYNPPPRDPSPYPLPPSYAATAEPDGNGGIARMPACHCRAGCRCSACGRAPVWIPATRGLDWLEVLPDGGIHRDLPFGWAPCQPIAEAGTCPDCCARPMRLAPLGWVCRRDTAHFRPFQWS